ncbi:unnamed protein product [Lactuca saligna]|uniref:Uncharacterized protein n=1 Tax=Lactuca saligna TaxID=75948 RepID=A0AA36EEF1_LACSI|nr:unnamed protein product [Lactuca saligna]
MFLLKPGRRSAETLYSHREPQTFVYFFNLFLNTYTLEAHKGSSAASAERKEKLARGVGGGEASSARPAAGCEGGQETGPLGAMQAAVATSLDLRWVCSTEEVEGARGSISGKGGFRCGRREGKREKASVSVVINEQYGEGQPSSGDLQGNRWVFVLVFLTGTDAASKETWRRLGLFHLTVHEEEEFSKRNGFNGRTAETWRVVLFRMKLGSNE